MRFLDEARDQALQTKVLMAGYESTEKSNACHRCGKADHKAKNCHDIKANAAKVLKDSSGEGDDKIKKEKKRLREECGKCPLCKERHTYTRLKDKEEWPSDRLFKCETFKNMSVRERAATLERLGSCPRCTSWNHTKAECRSPAKCGLLINGRKCEGEHSSMVCGSGNAYCGSVKPSPVCSYSSSSSDSSDSESSASTYCSSSDSELSSSGSDENFPDIYAETLLLFSCGPL